MTTTAIESNPVCKYCSGGRHASEACPRIAEIEYDSTYVGMIKRVRFHAAQPVQQSNFLKLPVAVEAAPHEPMDDGFYLISGGGIVAHIRAGNSVDDNRRLADFIAACINNL